MAKGRFANLTGIKLYNALLKQLGEANAKARKKQRLSLKERREIVTKQLYPYFKGLPKVTQKEVNSRIKGLMTGLAPEEICNPLYLSEAYLSYVEFYEIDNHIRRMLPQCLEVRVNGGDKYGMTKIFNTSNYSYYSTGVQKIIENIRKDVDNKSALAYFNGIVKVKPRKKDNGKGENYFVDYVLYINDIPETIDVGTSYSLPKKEEGKVEKVKEYLVDKFKILQKEKRRRKRQQQRLAEKKQDPEDVRRKFNKSIDEAISAIRLLLKNKVITKAEFQRQKADLLKRKR